MQNGHRNHRFLRFVEHVRTHCVDPRREATVLDLRRECRALRLTEFSDWSTGELDLVEQEAAGYADETDLAQVLSGTAPRPQADGPGAWLHSPSPFAWT